MRLSENTLAVLKNFSEINKSVVFQPGQIQSTISEGSSIFARVQIEESFPVKFGIYELSTFLSNIGQLGGPDADLTFDEKKVTIKSNNFFTLDYYGCIPDLIKNPDGRQIPEFDMDVTFQLSKDVMAKMMKLADLNNFPNIVFKNRDDDILMVVGRHKESPNSGQFVIGKTDKQFEFSFLREHLKILPIDYEIGITTQGGFGRFKSGSGNVQYFISLATT